MKLVNPETKDCSRFFSQHSNLSRPASRITQTATAPGQMAEMYSAAAFQRRTGLRMHAAANEVVKRFYKVGEAA